MTRGRTQGVHRQRSMTEAWFRSIVRKVAGAVGEAVAFGALAVMLWLTAGSAVSRFTGGRLHELTQTASRTRSSDAVLAHMWRLQLPGTAFACVVFVFLVFVLPRWRRSRGGLLELSGEATGGCVGLVLFGCPLPGITFTVWAATFMFTGMPILMVVDILPSTWSFAITQEASALLPLIPTWTLTSGLVFVLGGCARLQGLSTRERAAVRR